MPAELGHNSLGRNLSMTSTIVDLNTAIATLGLALKDARSAARSNQQQMVIVARALLQVDIASAEDETFADAQIRAAGVTLPSDLIASTHERSSARWLARGGVLQDMQVKNPSEINDLSPGSLNPLEARYLAEKRFAKTTTYQGIRILFAAEVKRDIRTAVDGGEGAITLDEVRAVHGDAFKSETIEAWVTDEQYRRSDKRQRQKDLKKAFTAMLEKAAEDESLYDKAEQMLKGFLREVRQARVTAEAERESKKKTKALSPTQRRLIEGSMKRAAERGDDDQFSDDDL
jgi:hypothetical protein